MTTMPVVRKVQKLYVSLQFAKFVIVGGIALVLNWLARIGLDVWLGYNTAIVGAYAIGMATAFALNRIFVFPDSKQERHREIALFIAVNVAAFPFVWVLSILLSDYVLVHIVPLDLARATGHGMAITTPVFVNFAMHKFLTFRNR